MKVLDFIENDLRRSRPSTTSLVVSCVVAALALAAFGLGLRADLVEAFTWSNLLPPLVMSGLLATYLVAFLSAGPWRRKAPWLALVTLGFIVLSFVQPQTPVSLHKFEESGNFWIECWHCLLFGAAASLLSTLVLAALFWKALPLPNSRWQKIFATLPGLCGVVALGYHCMGPLWTHVALSHWGQVFIVLPLAYLALRGVFRRRTRAALGQTSLVDLDRLS